MSVITTSHWSFSGPTGRRCSECALPIPEDQVPSERIDGSLLVECVACQDRRIEARQRFIRLRTGKASKADFCSGEAELWRLRVEGE